MNKPVLIGLGAGLVLFALLATSAFFIVPQSSQALVLQFGEPRRVVREPGLQMKIPFLQNVLYYDKRLLDIDPDVQQVILADQKRLDVDAFARFRITDPLTFYQTVNNEQGARVRLGPIINSSVRRVLGSTSLSAILSPEREKIMNTIRAEVIEDAKRFGVEIADVRLRRADLPEQTSQSIFDRMRSERQREAKEFRAQGQEQAQQIRSRADRDKVVLIAEAQREAQIMRGTGDAQAVKIYSDAFGQDATFFAFYRSMQAYREALGGGSNLVLSPDNEFLRYFGQSSAPAATQTPPPAPTPTGK